MAYEKNTNQTRYGKTRGETSNNTKDDFVPSTPIARLTCSGDKDDRTTNITGLWPAKVEKGERAGSVYLRGKDSETGQTYHVWLNDIEKLKDFIK
jgi:hypothetical protein